MKFANYSLFQRFLFCNTKGKILSNQNRPAWFIKIISALYQTSFWIFPMHSLKRPSSSYAIQDGFLSLQEDITLISPDQSQRTQQLGNSEEGRDAGKYIITSEGMEILASRGCVTSARGRPATLFDFRAERVASSQLSLCSGARGVLWKARTRVLGRDRALFARIARRVALSLSTLRSLKEIFFLSLTLDDAREMLFISAFRAPLKKDAQGCHIFITNCLFHLKMKI